MRKVFVGCLIVILCSAGCKKDKGCEPVAPEAEQPQIEKFVTDNNLVSMKNYRGIYYQIVDLGYGATPDINSTVVVTYTGKFLNGNIFDEKASADSFQLNKVIEGWQIGLPLIKKGGRIKMVIPSAYAYGCVGNGPIPPNAVLYFDVKLEDVK